MWSDIPGYEGYYQASSDGQIKSLSRAVKTKGGGVRLTAETILKPTPDADGYYSVGLHKDGVYRTFRVHRLVAYTFLPNPNNLPVVHHIDGNNQNNALSNLKWVTVSENTQDAVDRGVLTFDSGRLRTISRLGVEKTRKPVVCMDTSQQFYSISECARHLGVGHDMLVRHIVHREPIDGRLYAFVNEDDMNWADAVKSKYKPYCKTKPGSKSVRCKETGQVFCNQSDAERRLGLSPDSVRISIKENKSVKGMSFEYFNIDEEASE